jgi:benzoyl-CoA reductase/2-hydroxyglutaryl-CoA dehydratase subunit BcrC/BadD/HgdB
MTFFSFLDKVHKYITSVRIIKDHVSFDMVFNKNWVLNKSIPKTVEVLKNSEDDKFSYISFVCKITNESVTDVENLIDSMIKYNMEKEEKDKLFKLKVQELRSIFENQKLIHLKNLKFDIDELTVLINQTDAQTSDNTRDRESIQSIQD